MHIPHVQNGHRGLYPERHPKPSVDSVTVTFCAIMSGQCAFVQCRCAAHLLRRAGDTSKVMMPVRGFVRLYGGNHLQAPRIRGVPGRPAAARVFVVRLKDRRGGQSASTSGRVAFMMGAHAVAAPDRNRLAVCIYCSHLTGVFGPNQDRKRSLRACRRVRAVTMQCRQGLREAAWIWPRIAAANELGCRLGTHHDFASRESSALGPTAASVPSHEEPRTSVRFLSKRLWLTTHRS